MSQTEAELREELMNAALRGDTNEIKRIEILYALAKEPSLDDLPDKGRRPTSA